MFKLQFKDQPQRSVWLVGDNFKLGAGADNDLVLQGLGIEDAHASIAIDADNLVLQSKPGSCFVNDAPVDGEHILVANDELRIGKQRLLVIDPKQMLVKSVEEPKSADEQGVWALVPVHPKLQDRDFTINEPTLIGRSNECGFAVPYKLLSREHAQLSVVDGELHLKDLDSANGCFVNGERVTQAKLVNGDKVSFAKLAFTVHGPEAQQASNKVSPPEELNKTMIRPAINLEEALQRAAAESSESLALSDDDDDYAEVVPQEENKVSSASRWPLMVVIVVIAAVSIWWFSPLNTL